VKKCLSHGFLYTIILGHAHYDRLCRSFIGMVNIVILA